MYLKGTTQIHLGEVHILGGTIVCFIVLSLSLYFRNNFSEMLFKIRVLKISQISHENT